MWVRDYFLKVLKPHGPSMRFFKLRDYILDFGKPHALFMRFCLYFNLLI